MKPDDPIQLSENFLRRARLKRDQEFHLQRERQQTKDRQERHDQDDNLDILLTVAMATEQEVAVFRARLDDYEERATKHILALQRKLDQEMVEKNAMLDQAYILDDGRRVFKIHDEQRVIDEFGQDVSPDIIVPDEVPNHHPDGKLFIGTLNSLSKTHEALEKTIKFRDRVNEMQDEVDQGKISKDRLQELEQEFEDIMPDILKTENAAPEQKSEAAPDREVKTDPQITLGGM
ncbi:MAG: hypothetical protein OIF58_05160 [Cohaesibacter sp.]|nr:hypothetical protein [Cohaesibacter sp.]